MANQPKKYQKFVATAATATLVASAIVPVASANAGFTDITNYDAKVQGYINDLADRGIIKGTSETTFAPSTHISRGQVVKLLGRYLEEEQGYEIPEDWEDSRFDDVDVTKDAELAKYAALVYDAGVFTGNNGNLEATKKISRQNMAVVLDRAVEAITGTSLVELAAETDEEANVADLETAKESARDAIEALNILGISTVENFNPLNNVSRANFAKFLYLTIEQIGEEEVDYAAELEEILAAFSKLGKVTEDNLEDAQELVDAAKELLAAAVEAEAISEEDAAKAQAVIDAVQAQIDAIKKSDIDATDLRVTSKAASLTANGADNTVITFDLLGEDGKVDTAANDIVLEISTSFGNLANNRVTIQNGTASVVLTSEFSATDLTAKVTARVIETVSDNYKHLIGQKPGELDVKFLASAVGADLNTVTLLDAESNQADRVTLYFDKNVSVDSFVNTVTKTRTDGTTYTEFATTTVAGEVVQSLKAGIAVTQEGETNARQIKGIKAVDGNPKAIEVLLVKGHALDDNKRITVDAKIGTTANKKSFILTDARQPEFTSVTPTSLRTADLKFSEAVVNGTFTIDGLWDAADVTGIDKTSPAYTAAIAGKEFTIEFGDFNSTTGVDNRHTAKLVTLPYATGTDGLVTAAQAAADATKKLKANEGKHRYFTAGNHSITVTQLKDFAGLTDAANVSSSQTLTFNILANTAAPTATVTVESPEQFRVKFSSDVEFDLAAAGVASKEAYFAKAFTSNKTGFTLTATDIAVQEVQPNEYVVELTKDWTKLLDASTDLTNVYYNYTHDFKFAKETLINVANGAVNADIVASLNYAGSALNGPDNVSPVIDNILATADFSVYNVVMSEPVKLPGKDNATDTLAEKQTTLPVVTAEFQGTDKNGKAVVIPARVGSYVGTDGADRVFQVSTEQAQALQTLVNQGYGENWKVVVRSISDDIGNTASTVTKDFVVKPIVSSAGKFQLVSPENGLANKVIVFDNKTLRDAQGNVIPDRIEVTFTKGVVNNGGLSDLTQVNNWTFNGKQLTNVQSITVADTNNNTTDGYEKVIITFTNENAVTETNVSNVVAVNKNIVSKDGTALTGEFEVVAYTLREGEVLPVDAADVTAAINALPTTVTAADAAAIQAARAAYTALSAAEKAKVTAATVAKLEEAEKALADLAPAAVTLESVTAAIVNNGFGANVVTVNSNNLPANLKGAEGYVVTINGKEYTLKQSANKPENWSVAIPATEATEAQIKAGTIAAVVAPTAPFAGTITNNGFGANVVVVNANNLPTELQGKTSYTLTINGKAYALTQSKNKPENWSVAIPATEATEDQIKAGTVSGK